MESMFNRWFKRTFKALKPRMSVKSAQEAIDRVQCLIDGLTEIKNDLKQISEQGNYDEVWVNLLRLKDTWTVSYQVYVARSLPQKIFTSCNFKPKQENQDAA